MQPDRDHDLEVIVRELDARRRIHDVLMRYTRGVDHRDADLIRSCYHPGAQEDHGFYNGSAEGFVDAAVAAGAAFENMRHAICNEYVEFDARNPLIAYSETVVLACMTAREAGERMLGITACRFLDRFECQDGDWRIVDRKVVLDWETKGPTTGTDGTAMTFGMLRGLTSRQDPSFGLGFRHWGDAPIPSVILDRARI